MWKFPSNMAIGYNHQAQNFRTGQKKMFRKSIEISFSLSIQPKRPEKVEKTHHGNDCNANY